MKGNNDLSMEQTLEGRHTTKRVLKNLIVSSSERAVLKSLARDVAELANRPIEKKKKERWISHNNLNDFEPIIFIDPENGWNEIIKQDQLECENPILREWEMILRKEVFWATKLKDDRVIESFFNIPHSYIDTGWGLEEKIHETNISNGSISWDAPIKNYKEDLKKLKFPQIIVDFKTTNRILELAQDLFSGILSVRLKTAWWWSLGMTWEFIKLRGLTSFMMDMYDNPDEIHHLMSFLRDGNLKKLDYLEQNNLLSSNTDGTYVGSGGFGWTGSLPKSNGVPDMVRTKDMWGFAESQETVGVSPEQFAEFVLPYQKDILDRFSINCYGCCEPIDPRWDYVKTLPGLRRISASPWANKKRMSEMLGADYIMSVKPNPTHLARAVIEEDEARKEVKSILRNTRGSIVEFIMKDNHTLGNNPQNAIRWVELVREEIDKIY